MVLLRTRCGRRVTHRAIRSVRHLSRPRRLDLWLTPMTANPPARSDWVGLVASRVEPTEGPFIRLRVEAKGGWSSAIRVTASDGVDYFAKFPEKCTKNDPLGGMAVAVELVAAEAGRLIGAPMCDTVVLRVPPELLGTSQLLDGDPVTSTVVHASRALANADEQPRPRLQDRQRDDNCRRHAACTRCGIGLSVPIRNGSVTSTLTKRLTVTTMGCICRRKT
jgi:hypothetical protein